MTSVAPEDTVDRRVGKVVQNGETSMFVTRVWSVLLSVVGDAAVPGGRRKWLRLAELICASAWPCG